MEKNFTVVIGRDVEEIKPKPYYLSGEDKRNTIDIFNNFLENVGNEQNEAIVERKLDAMARTVISNVKRNKICDEHEEEIVNMISCLLENIYIGDSFTIKSIDKLNGCYSDIHLFNTVVKRLVKQGILIEKRMAEKYSYRYTYIKVYTRIK